MRLELILDLEPTVKVPERVQFGHENVPLSANHSSTFITKRALIGVEVYIFMPKLYTFRDFDGKYLFKVNASTTTILRVICSEGYFEVYSLFEDYFGDYF